jgi:hypothetical protein
VNVAGILSFGTKSATPDFQRKSAPAALASSNRSKGEEDALKLGGERQEAAQERGDQRQLVLDAVVIHQFQAGGGPEGLHNNSSLQR